MTQAEFSVVNTNYLAVLLRQRRQKQIKHEFRLFALLSPGLACETTYQLHDLVRSTDRYGKFNENLEFVSFTQCAPMSHDLCTCDIFAVHLLTKNGDVYLLNPVLLQVMAFREDYFSQLLVMINNLQEEERDKVLLKNFRMALMRGKESVKGRAGFCAVNIAEEQLS